MAGVGGVACHFVKGSSAGLKQRVSAWFTPGINGQAALRLGYNDGEFAFQAIFYGTHAAVVSWKANIEALQGEIVSIVDDWGATHVNCLVEKMTAVDRNPARGNGIASATCRGAFMIEGRVVA